MKLHPRVTKAAVELVERFEGLRRRAARLPDGSWTIGYGHTLSAREGAVVSPDDAEALLYYDLSEVATKVEAWTFTSLNQNQFEALIAFAFNIGLENFRHSTVLKRVNEGQHLQAAAAMELWRKTEVDGEGLVSDALVRRRAAEKAHYLTLPEGFRPSPTQVLRPAFDFSVIEAASHSQLAQRATVIDTPLDGDEATATVESSLDQSSAHKSEAPAEARSPVRQAGDQAVETLQGVLAEDAAAPALAEAVSAPVLNAPDAEPEPDAPDQPSNDAALAQADPSFPARAPVFRGFEPPPSRFGRREPPPALAPANEHQKEPETSAEVQAPPASEAVEPPPEFNLFNRPLAPPAPTATPEPTLARTVRLRGDTYEAELEPIDASPAHTATGELGSILQNRTVVWGAIGCVGVLFFALAITSMMIGRATLAHLAIGFLGVLLITPAGVYFLLRRSGETHAEPAALTESVIEPAAADIPQ